MLLLMLGLKRRSVQRQLKPKSMPDKQFSDPRLADLYDLGNAGSEDRDFYLALAGPTPKDILDLGCGTGLLSLAYAKAGHRVVGVDPASAMLDVARRNDKEAQVEWIEAYAERFETRKRFDLIIMTGHAFQVLLSDEQVALALACMSKVLKPSGRVVFESRNPALDWDQIWAKSYVMDTSEGQVRAERRITDSSRVPDYLSFAWDYHFADGVLTSESTLRFLDHGQILNRAIEAGLELTALYGNWDGTGFDLQRSEEMIFEFHRSSVEPV